MLTDCSLRLPFGLLLTLLFAVAAVPILIDFSTESTNHWPLIGTFLSKHPLGGVGHWPIGTIEGDSFNHLFDYLLALAIFTVGANLLRLIMVWRESRRMLRRFSWHPLRESCAQLGFWGGGGSDEDHGGAIPLSSTPPRPSLAAPIPTFYAIEFSIEQAEWLAEHLGQAFMPTDEPDLKWKICLSEDKIRSKVAAAKEGLKKALADDADGNFSSSRAKKVEVQETLANLTGIVANILEPKWDLGMDSSPSTATVADKWRQRAGLFLASRVVDYSRHILAQVRNLMVFTIAAAVAILIGISSYSFPASDTLLRLSWMLLLVAVIIGVWVAVQVSREETFSLLSGGTPGKIDWDAAFVAHLGLYAVLPILAILGIQFPATMDGIVQSITSMFPGAGH